jgi:hypothetical protein
MRAIESSDCEPTEGNVETEPRFLVVCVSPFDSDSASARA